jgi:NADPH2:quinone reductase
MRAILCEQFRQLDGSVPADALVIKDVADLNPGRGEVLIAAEACGVNFPDSLIIQGRYQVKPTLPFSPGFEVAGTVLALGEGVQGLSVGQRVAGHPLFGCFAEQVVVPAIRVFPIPDVMDYATAAGFLIPYGTSYNALKNRAQLQAGETLLVMGAAGGIGLTAVELGNIMGARVIAMASSADKLALCKQYGAHETINYAELSSAQVRERIKQLTNGRGIDVVYDPVGGDYTEPMVRSLAQFGRYLTVGFAAGAIPKVPLNLLLLKIASLVGSYWGPYIDAYPERNAENMTELFAWYAAGKIKPHISKTYPMEQVVDAINHVLARQVQGKTVLIV